MNNKKGFVFIETILTIVVLTTTLVILYGSYSRSVQSEKRRLYYDDISYVYKTMVIRDAFSKSVNTSKFKFALDNAQDDFYFYMFSSGSDIFRNNSLMTRVRELYNYKVLIYVPFEMIAPLKACANSSETTTDVKCKNTLDKINDFADSTFVDYVKSLSIDYSKVSSVSNIKGILISLIYEAKDGGAEVDKGAYESCLQHQIFEHYGVVNGSQAQKEAAIQKYYDEPGLSYDMHCENAFYNSWVYL